ncbi:MAG TPA: hypothetical protein VK395_18150 [Gemmataceae bacterium]|nr:hypothetical protein [Gemmataceae bacterium]
MPTVQANVSPRQMSQGVVAHPPVLHQPAAELLDGGQVKIAGLNARAPAEAVLQGFDGAPWVTASPAHSRCFQVMPTNQRGHRCWLDMQDDSGLSQCVHLLAWFKRRSRFATLPEVRNKLLHARGGQVRDEEKPASVDYLAGALDRHLDVKIRIPLGNKASLKVLHVIGQRASTVLLERIDHANFGHLGIGHQLGQHLLAGSFVSAKRDRGKFPLRGLVFAVPDFGLTRHFHRACRVLLDALPVRGSVFAIG